MTRTAATIASATSLQQAPFHRDVLRRAFACFPSGVTAVCAMSDGRPQGMAASSFTSVSLEPPLVSVCVARSSTTWPKLAQLPALGVSVLSQAQGHAARTLAAKGIDRFADLDCETLPSGAILVRDSSLWLECAVHSHIPAGDHELVLLEVLSLQPHPDVMPMVFHRSEFHCLSATSADRL